MIQNFEKSSKMVQNWGNMKKLTCCICIQPISQLGSQNRKTEKQKPLNLGIHRITSQSASFIVGIIFFAFTILKTIPVSCSCNSHIYNRSVGEGRELEIAQ